MTDLQFNNDPFTPIGGGSNIFEGTFDGNGHSIRFLEIEDETSDYVGLFSQLDYGAVVKNLTMLDCEFRGDEYVGAITGWNDGTIDNCIVTASASGGGRARGNLTVGGIAGQNRGTISQCEVRNYSDARAFYIRSYGSNAGGIAGVNTGANARIENCSVESNVRGDDDNVGGIVGWNYSAISECQYNYGYIDGNDWGTGGIVGQNSSGTISNCGYYGIMWGNTFTGGIIGWFDGGTIEYCLAAGTVNPPSSGGLVGRAGGSIFNSFWDTQTTGKNSYNWDGSSSVTNSHGETTSELKKRSTYTTKHDTFWDIDSTWVILEDTDYSRLSGNGDKLPSPSNLSASTTESDGVHLSWDLLSFNLFGNSYPAFYKILRSDSPDTEFPETEVTGWIAGNAFVDATALPEAEYYYWILSASSMRGDRQSNNGNSTLGARVYPDADTPVNVSASDSIPYSILIEWDEPFNAEFYRVYRSIAVSGAKTPLGSWQTGLSYSDIPPYSDTVYYYWVRAAMNDTGGYISDYGGPDSGYYIEPDDILPTISISVVPTNPIETQICTLHVSAGDNDALDYVTIWWSVNGVQDYVIWDNIGSQALDSSHIVGAFAANDTLKCWARALDVSGNSAESEQLTRIIIFENVSQPSHLTGPVCLKTNQLGAYETGGSISNLGNPIQYRFNWADSISSWGDSAASRTWESEGAYPVKAQARSLSDTNRVSDWSVSLFVVIDSSAPQVTVKTYERSITDTVYNIESLTISGESRDDEPSSGLASTEINTGDDNSGDQYEWSFDVDLYVGSNVFIVTTTDNAGNVGADTLNLIMVGVYDLETSELPDRFVLNQNYPNPFNPSTSIEFDLPRRSWVRIDVFNLLGQRICSLVDEECAAGSYRVDWDGHTDQGSKASTGVYFYRIETDGYTATKKMLLLK